MKEMILVAVGGSGARVAQSVVVLAAAGFPDLLVREPAKLTIRLVDIDVKHEDGNELRKMIESYHAAFKFLWEPNVSADRDGWRPLEIELENPDIFSFQTGLDGGENQMVEIEDFVPLLDRHPESRLLLDALYSEEDRKMDLRCGCKARPRVGALLWEYIYRRNNAPFWSTLVAKSGTPSPTRIMFVGSLFGGTGASGVPTLARLFNQSIANCADCQIALTLMAPYFYLEEDSEKKWEPGEIKVDFKQTDFQSKMALNYYMLSDILPSVECIQVVGNNERKMVVEKEGTIKEVKNKGDNLNQPQDDPSVPTELTAAIGIMRFFTGTWGKGVFVPRKEKKPDWGIFPEADKVRASLQQLQRFCLMTMDYYTPLSTNVKRALAPAFVKELWEDTVRYSADWESVWSSETDGVGSVMKFSVAFQRWFRDMDNNGLQVLEMREKESILNTKAERGEATSINLMGKKGRVILGDMNERVPYYLDMRKHLLRQEPKAEAYVLSLMDACETPVKRAAKPRA